MPTPCPATLVCRPVSQENALAGIQAATDNIRQLMSEAACGNAPPEAAENIKKAWKKHVQRWFKSTAGGVELAEKMFALGRWPQVQPQLLPFVNAVRDAVGLPAVQTVD